MQAQRRDPRRVALEGRVDEAAVYAKAREGRLSTLTGSGSPYEAPAEPELTIRTLEEDVDAAVARLIEALS